MLTKRSASSGDENVYKLEVNVPRTIGILLDGINHHQVDSKVYFVDTDPLDSDYPITVIQPSHNWGVSDYEQ